MTSIQTSLRYIESDRAKFIVEMIQEFISDLRKSEAIDDQFILPAVFPLNDFQTNKNGVPIFAPLMGASLNITPIHLAALEGKKDVINLLLGLYDVNHHSENCMVTPLFMALINDHSDVAKFLMERGATTPSGPCADGIHAAARRGFLHEIVQLVQDFGVNPNSRDAGGATPVMYALYLAEQQAIETISLLFELGAKTDTVIEELWTYDELAWAMEKEVLASWIKSRTSNIYTYTLEYVERQVREMITD